MHVPPSWQKTLLSRSFCHNDCHQGNVRFDGGKAWLVDWATAGPGDPMKEVGYFACQVGCHGSMDFETLVNKYDAALSPNDIRRARCYFAWTHAYWYLADLRETSPDDAQDRARRLQAIEPDLIDDGLWLGFEEVSVRQPSCQTAGVRLNSMQHPR